MKCENCSSELVGAAIVCRQCNHNNAQGRVSQWRARRTGELPKPSASTRTISPLSNASKPEAARSSSPESRLLEPKRSGAIPFEPKIQINHAAPSSEPLARPSTVAASSPLAAEEDQTIGQYPPWRAQLKERVKQSRERKVVGATVGASEPDEAELDPNPIVEAALKRIRWAEHTPATPATLAPLPCVARNGSQAAALAEESELTVEPKREVTPPAVKADVPAEPKLEARPAVRNAQPAANPLLARKSDTQPVARTETKPLPPRQAAIQKPAPGPQPAGGTEAGVEVKPAVKLDAKPAVEGKVAEPKSRVTGELKTPRAAEQPATPATTARKTVETKIIEIPQSTAPAPTGKLKPLAKLPASIWVRTLAGACDFEIIATAYLPLFASYATLNTSLGRESLSIMFVLLATLTFCYQMLTLVLADRTSGMACLNLRLINVAGGDRPISLTQKFARAVAATAAFLCPPLNLIVMQSNQQRYTLPDLLSGTTLAEK